MKNNKEDGRGEEGRERWRKKDEDEEKLKLRKEISRNGKKERKIW